MIKNAKKSFVIIEKTLKIPKVCVRHGEARSIHTHSRSTS